jgi:hypothetical protein
MDPPLQIVPPDPAPLSDTATSGSGALVHAPPHASDAPLTLSLVPARPSEVDDDDAAATTPPNYGSDLDSDGASAVAALLDEAEFRAAASPAALATAVRIVRPAAAGTRSDVHGNAAPAWIRRGRLVRRSPAAELVDRERPLLVSAFIVLTD